MLVQAPPSVPVELFTTDIAHEVGIEFDIFVPGTEKFIPTQQALVYIPYMDTDIGFVSPAASEIFESFITFAALERHVCGVDPGLVLLTGPLRLECFQTDIALKSRKVVHLLLVLLQQRFGWEYLAADCTIFPTVGPLNVLLHWRTSEVFFHVNCSDLNVVFFIL